MMKSYSSRELIKMVEADGWHLVNIVGSHHQFTHPTKPGKVTIPHPRKNLSPAIIRSIFKQAGIN